MRFVELEVGHDLVGLFKLLVAFATKTDDDVGVDGDIGNGFTNVGDKLTIFAVGIAALHVFKYLVIARLDRYFDMLADFGQIAHGVEDAIGHVIGMAGQEANAPEPFDFMDGTQQIGQVKFRLCICDFDLKRAQRWRCCPIRRASHSHSGLRFVRAG